MGVHPDDPNFLCYNYFIWTQWRPKMAQKIFCSQKVKVRVKVNSHSRPLRFHHLLLQFLTDLDETGCILFTIGWANFVLLRILNFYPPINNSHLIKKGHKNTIKDVSTEILPTYCQGAGKHFKWNICVAVFECITDTLFIRPHPMLNENFKMLEK